MSIFNHNNFCAPYTTSSLTDVKKEKRENFKKLCIFLINAKIQVGYQILIFPSQQYLVMRQKKNIKVSIYKMI